MASQILSGSNNVFYANNTGQNVRLIINYMSNVTNMNWNPVFPPNVRPDTTLFVNISSTTPITIGKTVPISYTSTAVTTGQSLTLTPITNSTFPVELMLPSTYEFRATCGAFNIIIIKEDGT